MYEVVTPSTQLPPLHSSGVCSAGVDTCTSHIPTLHTPTFVGTTSTAIMTTHDAVITNISHAQDKVHIEAPLEREGETEVMVVADVTTEVGVRTEAEVKVQLQIVIQLHQIKEFHSSQQYSMLGQREDQGQHRQEREGHCHRLHRQSLEGHMQGRECHRIRICDWGSHIFRESMAGDR
ncbi:hypothetical protein ACSBR2_040015 [Camellia fascicularis]